MSKSAAILVIVVSTNSCTLDNINGAEVHRIYMQSKSECIAVAEALNPRKSVRAYCEVSKEKSDE